MSDNVTLAALVQRITQDDVQTEQDIRGILSGFPSEVREYVIGEFRENETLRYLFPEKAQLFDQNNFNE